MSAHICEYPLYEYTYNGKEWRFEYRPIGVPYWPVRKDGETFERLPPASSDYWKMLKEWGKSIETEEQ